MAATQFPVFSAPAMKFPSESRSFCRNSPLLLDLKLKRKFLGDAVVGRRNSVPSIRNKGALASVVLVLPTAKPERAITVGDVPKWSARAVKAFGMAEAEARKLKHPNTGTESLLMGILVEGTSFASKFLRKNGITFIKVKPEIVEILGKAFLFFESPICPPLTEPAQRALDWAVDEKIKSGKDGEVTVSYLLLGIWAQKDYGGHKVLASLGFDDTKAQELANCMNDLPAALD